MYALDFCSIPLCFDGPRHGAYALHAHAAPLGLFRIFQKELSSDPTGGIRRHFSLPLFFNPIDSLIRENA
jgi:hypothetical protein